MKDQSILNSAEKKSESYLDDLAFAICVNGESIEKYKKIVEKKYGTDVYSNMVQFVQTSQQQVSRRQFTNTSILSLKHLGKNAGMSGDAIEMIIDHFNSKVKEERRIHEEDECWNNCPKNNRDALLGYLRKYPKGRYVKDAHANLKIIEKEENAKREEMTFWKQVNQNDKHLLKAYLIKYPTGKYVDRARLKIAELERIEKEAIGESRFFNQCHTQRDYMNYLSKYPNGAYYAKAKTIIEELERKEAVKIHRATEENRAYNLCKDKKDYQNYLRDYPNGKYSYEAETKIRELEFKDYLRQEETKFWNQCNHNDKQSLKDYLKKYPHGYYRNKAMYEIDMLDKASKKESDAYVKEQKTYEHCKTKDDYLHYISLYPNGKYVSMARNKIEHLEKIERIKEGIKKEKEKEKIKISDVVPDEIRDKLIKLNKLAGRSYFLAALAFAFLPNVFRWNHWAHIEQEFEGNAPTLWLFWLPIVVTIWGYYCRWVVTDEFSSISKTRKEMDGWYVFTVIPCFVLLAWMGIYGLNMSYFMEDILKVFMGPIVCGIAWCYGLYCEYKMSCIAKNLLPDNN